MSKKSKQTKVLQDNVSEEQLVSAEQKTVQTQNVKQMADQKKKDKTKKKEKKPNVIGKKLKEVGSELKKVSWPSFSKVVKQTSVVFAVVLIFTAVLLGIDKLLGELFKLLISSLS